MNIYVGNLSYDLTENDLREEFGTFGQVDSVNIIMDRDSGRSKGFGFVEMPEDEEAKAAIAGMDTKDLKGRALKVNPARPRSDSPKPRRDFY